MGTQSTLNSRLAYVRRTIRLSARALAERLKALGFEVSYRSILAYESGDRKPSDAYLEALSGATGVPLDWIRTGYGEDEPRLATDGDPGGLGGYASSPVEPAFLAGLGGLSRALRWEFSGLLRDLARMAGIPAGDPEREFYRQIGALMGAPFNLGTDFVRPMGELNGSELASYARLQLTALSTILRRSPSWPDGMSRGAHGFLWGKERSHPETP